MTCNCTQTGQSLIYIGYTYYNNVSMHVLTKVETTVHRGRGPIIMSYAMIIDMMS